MSAVTAVNRMFRVRVGVFVLLVATLNAGMPVSAQTPSRVQVDPLENASGQAQLDALGTTITDGIALTLRLLDRYEVRTRQVPAGAVYTPAALRQRALSEETDNIIFGDISRNVRGGYLVTIRVFDLGLDAILFEDTVAFESLLDAFDVVDEITLSLVEGFSGIRVTFGGLDIGVTAPGTGAGNEAFQIRVNDVELPPGTRRLDRIPAGEHRVVIQQVRPLETWVSSETVSVSTDRTTSVSFSIPEVTDVEATVLDAGVMAWQTLATDARADRTMREQFERAKSLLRSEFFQRYRQAFALRYLERFDSVEAPTTVEARSGVVDDWMDFSVAGGFRRVVPMQRTISEHAIVPGEVPGVLSSDIVPEFRTILLDGLDDDWGGSSVRFDPIGDTRVGIVDDRSAADLVEFSAAYDHENLYLMYRTQDRMYRRQRLIYRFRFEGDEVALGYIDASPADFGRDQIGAGYTPPGSSQSVEWTAVRSRTRIAYDEGSPQSVLEIAVPLDAIADWPHVARRLRYIWIGTEYELSGRDSRLDELDGVTGFVVPMRGLLLAKE